MDWRCILCLLVLVFISCTSLGHLRLLEREDTDLSANLGFVGAGLYFCPLLLFEANMHFLSAIIAVLLKVPD